MRNQCNRHRTTVQYSYKNNANFVLNDSRFFRNTVLREIRLPPNLCVYRSNVNCNAFVQYRTTTGVCNNLQRPYEGSSQTAFARLLPPAYEDGTLDEISVLF